MILTYKPFENYVLIDLETTGLSAKWDEIIEICCLKIHNGSIVDEFTTLVKPNCIISDDIIEITGITNEMVENSPKFHTIKNDVKKFISNYPILGHNVTFDINFLINYLDYDFSTVMYCDTMYLGRRLLQDLKHYRLSDLANYFHLIFENAHRSKEDCLMTKNVYEKLCELIPSEGLQTYKKTKSHGLNLNEIIADESYIDVDNLFYKRYCVFTGTLDKMIRREAAQLVANVGGYLENGVTKKTNYLILGSNDYCKSIKDGKSSKQKKAEKLKKEGQDIEIITEDEFYSIFELNESSFRNYNKER